MTITTTTTTTTTTPSQPASNTQLTGWQIRHLAQAQAHPQPPSEAAHSQTIATGSAAPAAPTAIPSAVRVATTLAIYSGKGGSGKTTTTLNLGAALARAGKRVLYVDWDGGQASLSASLLALVGEEVYSLKYGLYEAIHQTVMNGVPANPQQHKAVFEQAIRCVRWLDHQRQRAILANNLELAALETEMADLTSREYLLKRFLQYFRRTFDFILIDCPANRGLLTVNALTAADYLVLPVETTPLGWQASRSMLEHPRFLPSITGRSWSQELERMGLSWDAWEAAKPGRQPAPTSGKELGSEVSSALHQMKGKTEGLAMAGTETGSVNGTGNSEGMDEVFAMALEDSHSQIVYPNPALKVAALIPFRYNPEFTPNREVLAALSQIFGPPPGYDKQPKRFQPSATGPGRPGLLMPPVTASATYQRSFNRNADAAELNRRFAPLWDYVAAHLITLTQAGQAQG